MKSDVLLEVAPLGFVWPTLDPFLFCVHHKDAYPAGTAELGVEPRLLSGRNLGMDFEVQDGFRMYHGEVVPGFPKHPHRGFETVTIVREGLIDHSDSLGATARFGGGDVQWMTAGKGVVHSEMFPLVRSDAPNPLELFQIWLNLPAVDKMQPPYFTMLWNERVPKVVREDAQGRRSEVTVIAGSYQGAKPPPSPPHSWAARDAAELNISTVRLDPGARCQLPGGSADANRVLYFFEGQQLTVQGQPLQVGHYAKVRPELDLELVNGGAQAELLVLHARPINEPVAHHGPFVMNTRAELVRAFEDYQATEFGGWSFDSDAPVHPQDAGRFAVHADGRRELPTDPIDTP